MTATHDGLRLEPLRGEAIHTRLEPLARVRMRVFRDWPYLYEGSLDYEKRYLQIYARSPRSLAVLVWDGTECVGASTVIPLADENEDAKAPFRKAGIALEEVDYFGESILLPQYRGRGVGVKFFELREAHAREHGLPLCAFCAVERASDHPARPADYVPNDAFWSRRGYRKVPELQTSFSWPDVGDTESTAKPMTFWLKRLT